MLQHEVEYHTSNGATFRNSVADILTHVALHGSYHRGQIALVTREAGPTPVPTDYNSARPHSAGAALSHQRPFNTREHAPLPPGSGEDRTNRVAVITGGSRGIGAASARLAAQSGFAVCVNFLNEKAAAESVVHDIVSQGGRALAVQADVSHENEWKTQTPPQPLASETQFDIY